MFFCSLYTREKEGTYLNKQKLKVHDRSWKPQSFSWDDGVSSFWPPFFFEELMWKWRRNRLKMHLLWKKRWFSVAILVSRSSNYYLISRCITPSRFCQTKLLGVNLRPSSRYSRRSGARAVGAQELPSNVARFFSMALRSGESTMARSPQMVL